MSRQNLGTLIVVGVVVLGLVVAIFIVPTIQSPQTEARNRLDQAAEQGARRLNVMERMAAPAVAADRARLLLPEAIRKPDAEAIQRAIANNLTMINDSAGKVSGEFRRSLEEQDKQYEAVAREKPSDGDRGEIIQVPAGENAQVNWIKQLLARGQDPAASMTKDLDNAIGQLQQSIAAVSSVPGYSGTDHFRANWVLAGLQYQKAMLLANLAANHRAKADAVRVQVVSDFRSYTTAVAGVKGLQSRLAAVSLAPATPAAPEAPKAVAPRNPLQAAVDEAGPQPVASTDEAAAPPAQESPGTAGLLSRVGSLLKGAAAAPAASQPAEPIQKPAAVPAAGAAPVESPALTALGETEDPSVLAAKYEQEIEEQIAATQKKIAGLQQVIAGPQQQLDRVNQELQQLQAKLAELEQAGYDVTSLESFEAYKKTYSSLSDQIRTAEAAAQALQEGTMAGAQLDPDSGDDLTKAKYTGGQPEAGLTTLNRRLAGQQRTLDLLKAARQEMQDMRASLQQARDGSDKALQQAQAAAKQQADQLAGTYAEMDAELVAADGLENNALGVANNAVQSYNIALQAAKKQQLDAADELRVANPAPDKPNDRLDWLSKYDSPQAASEYGLWNTYMLISQIQLQRAVSLQASVSLVKSIQAAGVPAKAAEMDKAIQESLDAAVAALNSGGSASDALQHATSYGGLISREKFQWLGAAARGLVYNAEVQAQLAKGQPEKAAEARTKAIEALAEATKGAENSEVLQPYTNLLASLRKTEQ